MITILPAIFLFKYFEKSVSKNYLKEVQIKEAETTLFVSKKVAHDIRSPLTALNMVLYKIKASDFPQVILATKAVERINKIADDLLNKSDTRLNSSSLKELHTSLLLLIDEKMLEFQKTIDFKIKLMKSENKNLLFKGENDKIIRILSNLINNAKEACEKNQKQNYIFIESKFIKGNLQISIKDNGNGMSPDDLNMLGKLGYSTKQKELGTSGHGMGIYSAIDYLKTIDGSLTYESKQTKGTIATVSLAPVPR
jgi:signal transduction histidine kinase